MPEPWCRASSSRLFGTHACLRCGQTGMAGWDLCEVWRGKCGGAAVVGWGRQLPGVEEAEKAVLPQVRWGK